MARKRTNQGDDPKSLASEEARFELSRQNGSPELDGSRSIEEQELASNGEVNLEIAESGIEAAPVERDVSGEIDETREELGIEVEKSQELTATEKFVGMMEVLYPHQSSEMYDPETLEMIVGDDLERREKLDLLFEVAIKVHDELPAAAERAREASKAVSALNRATVKAQHVNNPYTGNHVAEVATYGAEVAVEKLGYDEDPETLEGTQDALELHDIGKNEVDTFVLNSTDKYTPDMSAEMNKHPVYGKKVLGPTEAQAGYIASVEGIWHHEKFVTGDGYPDGLRGAEIPGAARICAVADTYQALEKERPYKPAIPSGRAIEMQNTFMSGHFDPVVLAGHTDMFLSNHPMFGDGFDFTTADARIDRLIREGSPYAEKVVTGQQSEVLAKLKGMLVDGEGADPMDIINAIDQLDVSTIQKIDASVSSSVDRFDDIAERRVDAAVDGLFILSGTINACLEGVNKKAKNITAGDVRAQHRARLALMMGQALDVELTAQEQQKLIGLALTKGVDYIGVHAEKLGGGEILGVADFMELQESSKAGRQIYAELGDSFKGMVPVDLDKLPPAEREREELLNEIVDLSSTIVAMSSFAEYREKVADVNERVDTVDSWLAATAPQRKSGKGWSVVRQLWAGDLLRTVAKGARPEVISQSKKVMREQVPDMIYQKGDDMEFMRELLQVGADVAQAGDDKEKVFNRLIEGIKFRNRLGRHDNSESGGVLSKAAADIALETLDFDKFLQVEEARRFDGEVAWQTRSRGLDQRLAEAMQADSPIEGMNLVKKAAAMLENKILDRGCMERCTLRDELSVQEDTANIMATIRTLLPGLKTEIRQHRLKGDEIAVDAGTKVLKEALQILGDDSVTQKTEEFFKEMELIREQKYLSGQMRRLRMAVDKKDIFNGETFVIRARKAIEELGEEAAGFSMSEVDDLENDLYRKGYLRLLSMIDREIKDENSAGVYALALIKKVEEVVREHDVSAIKPGYLEKLTKAAADKVQTKANEFFDLSDLSLRDVSKIDIWLQAVHDAREVAGQDGLSDEEVSEIKAVAEARIRKNLPGELEGVLSKGDPDQISKFVSNIYFYRKRLSGGDIAISKQLEAMKQQAGDKLFKLKTERWGEMIRQEHASDEVLTAISNWGKFCIETDRDGEYKGTVLEMSDEQNRAMDELSIAAYENKMQKVIGAIREFAPSLANVLSGVEPRQRLMKDIESTARDMKEVERLWMKIYGDNEDSLGRFKWWQGSTLKDLQDAVSVFAMSEAGRHIDNGSTVELFNLVRDLNAAGREEALSMDANQILGSESVGELVAGYSQAIVSDLIAKGDWSGFKRWTGEVRPILAGRVSTETRDGLYVPTADDQERCLRNHVKLLIMQLREEGGRNYVHEVVRLVDRIEDLNAEFPTYGLLQEAGKWLVGISDTLNITTVKDAAFYYNNKFVANYAASHQLFTIANGVCAKIRRGIEGGKRYILGEIESQVKADKEGGNGRSWMTGLMDGLDDKD